MGGCGAAERTSDANRRKLGRHKLIINFWGLQNPQKSKMLNLNRGLVRRIVGGGLVACTGLALARLPNRGRGAVVLRLEARVSSKGEDTSDFSAGG